jgi:hypothetical protein
VEPPLIVAAIVLGIVALTLLIERTAISLIAERRRALGTENPYSHFEWRRFWSGWPVETTRQ